MHNSLEKVFCRACNQPGENLLKVKQTGEKHFNYFHYLHCEYCYSLSIIEIPENISDYYQGYYSYNNFDISDRITLIKFIRKIIYRIPVLWFLFNHLITNIYEWNLKSIGHIKLKKNDKILDVGSGSGKFIFDLHDLGYRNSVGIDPYIYNEINYQNGAKILKAHFFDMVGSYKLITFHHTLEHMENLDAIFKKLRSLLAKDGICIIRIPNVDSFSFKRFKEYWTGIHAPYHFVLPSYNAMSHLLKKNGLEIDSIRGEQSLGFFLANVENELDVVEPNTMFIKFHNSHTKMDVKYWKKKLAKIKENHIDCEWIVYYVRKSACDFNSDAIL